MNGPAFVHAVFGLLPVVTFLAGLVYLDSYRLVGLRPVLLTIAMGGVAAIAAYGVNQSLLDRTALDLADYSRFVAPLTEEMLKALIVVGLIRLNRVGFLVDAAIFGFAVGAGFALVENLYFLYQLPQTHIGVWIVRGFGTAIMHGGATAIFAVASRAMISQKRHWGLSAYLPGLLVAVVVHAVFNQFFVSPVLNTIGVLVCLPILLSLVFRQSEKLVEDWLDIGFDSDTELLELINSGDLSRSHVGQYLTSLKEKFDGPVVADLLCYLRIHVELALRAKGLLMMRESGFDVAADAETRAKLQEMKFLEQSIGKTGKLAILPFLQMSRKDLWQFYMLGK